MKISRSIYRICIVGSGPSGCYLAKSLIKYSMNKNIHLKIDMIDSLDKPYGLIRYGIAPDNNQLKKLMNKFDNSLFKKYSDKIRFIGNVTVGHDICLSELKKIYDVLVLAIGGSQSFNTIEIKYLEKKLTNKLIGGIFPSRDWVFYYNNHPKFKNMLNLSNSMVNHEKELSNSNLNMDIELNYLKKKSPLYFEYKSPIKNSTDKNIFKNENEELNYGYTSDLLRNHILNSNERNAVIIGNGNVALDIARLLSFYEYNQLLKNNMINKDYLNFINKNKEPNILKKDEPLFKNIYIIGRRGWIQNSFKYSLLKEFIEKSRNSNLHKLNQNPILRVMMPKEDYDLSQNEINISEIEKSGNHIKKKYIKMKTIFEEMVNNYQNYINNNDVIRENNVTNIYFMNLRSPINIFTKDINIGIDNNKNDKIIPFINGLRLARNKQSSQNSQELVIDESRSINLPCQLLITSLGLKPSFKQIYNETEISENDNSCLIFKTGWMETNSKGDLSTTYQNSLLLSRNIISSLNKITPKNFVQ